MHVIVQFFCNNYMKCTKYETCAKLYTFPAVVDLHCWHAQRMDVDEGSVQNCTGYISMDMYTSAWICILEAFVHMQ